jgi:hypothetical protein
VLKDAIVALGRLLVKEDIDSNTFDASNKLVIVPEVSIVDVDVVAVVVTGNSVAIAVDESPVSVDARVVVRYDAVSIPVVSHAVCNPQVHIVGQSVSTF